ncbi:class I SAM-dependent RNA methyltransferase [Candidatus Dojkabacteria bacterium]|nr:class I SAM-dependent RNA methyltransferase [Candidatus Dojkabacteria bacterium]
MSASNKDNENRKVLYKTLRISHVNEKGFGVACFEGVIYWVLNALPGEVVEAVVIKKKKKIRRCLAIKIIEKSKHRIESVSECYLSTSCWEIMSFKYENQQKVELVRRLFKNIADVDLPDFEISFDENRFSYRNKAEFSLFYDYDNKIWEFAFFNRDSRRGKCPISRFSLISDSPNRAATKLLSFINGLAVESGKLKSVLVRYSNFTKETNLALYVKDEEFSYKKEFKEFFNNLKDSSDKVCGLHVIYSDPKSPASVSTKILYSFGQEWLSESLLGKIFRYPYYGFFQINPNMFEFVLHDMRELVSCVNTMERRRCSDIYSGAGSIGISLADLFGSVLGVDSFTDSQKYSLQNAKNNGANNFEFIEGLAEKLLSEEELKKSDFMIFDPPRPGIHPKLMNSILKVLPKNILYLSCNPATMASDFNSLKKLYQIKFFKVFNFYPCTPHVECLAYFRKV